MTRAGTLPLSEIADIKIYTKTARNRRSDMMAILKETGGDFVMNGAIFLKSLKPCCHLKADGKVLCAPDYTAWGISWNTPADFCVERVANAKANYIECVHLIVENKLVLSINCGADMRRARPRTAIGVKEGRFAYYVTNGGMTPEELRGVLFDAGWSDAIMMDGGGSTCFMDKDGNGFTGDGRKIPHWVVVTLKKTDHEPDGGKPEMTDGIVAYSLKQDGEKYVAKNFQVKEFACKDGSDVVLIHQKLPMVLQYIRTRCGRAVKLPSAYRTVSHNASPEVGGSQYSQHCYGTAADISVSGVSTKTLKTYAREIMPDWGGVGIYDWGIHVDVRKEKADWNG